jgi:hypothetical protein
MTPLHMTSSDFKRLTKNIPPKGMSKGDLMHLHLLIVEAMLNRRITPEELRSPRFTTSRDEFTKLMSKWKGAK